MKNTSSSNTTAENKPERTIIITLWEDLEEYCVLCEKTTRWKRNAECRGCGIGIQTNRRALAEELEEQPQSK